jgi:hypothetical protein
MIRLYGVSMDAPFHGGSSDNRVRRSYSFSFETGENVSVSHFASNREKKFLSKFLKLNLFVFVRDGGKCERFTLRFVLKKM